MKNNTQKSTQNRGFTLVEIMVVLIVLAVLAAIAVPALTGYIQRAKDSKMIAECTACVASAQSLSDMRAEAGQKWPYLTILDAADVIKVADAPSDSHLLSLDLQDDEPTLTELTYLAAGAENAVEYKNGAFNIVPITKCSAQAIAEASELIFKNKCEYFGTSAAVNRKDAIIELSKAMGLNEFLPVDHDLIVRVFGSVPPGFENLHWVPYPLSDYYGKMESGDVIYYANDTVTTADSYTGSDSEQRYNMVYINGELYYCDNSVTDRVAAKTINASTAAQYAERLVNYRTNKWKKWDGQ